MKKLFNLAKIHENKNYENQLFELNVNPQFYEEIIRNSTICMNADIEEKYINVPVHFNNILFVIKQRIYVDTRTSTVYDHVEELDDKYSYYINMSIYQKISKDIIRHLCEFKPLGNEKFFMHEDHIKLIKEVMGEE